MTEPTDKQLPDEQQLDEYLKGDSSVSRQYRQLHGAEVPTELDRLVLRQAEDAVKNRPAQSRPAWVRWTAPLAVAASAVLVLSIVVQTGVRDETAVLHAPQATMEAKRERAESATEETIVTDRTAPIAPGFVPPAEVSSEAADARPADPASPQQVAPAAPSRRMREQRASQGIAEPMNDAAQAVRPAPPANEAAKAMRAEPANEAPAAVAESVNEEPQPFVESRPPPPPVAAPARTPTIMPTRSVSRAADDAEQMLRAAMDETVRKQSAAAGEAAREAEYSNAQRASSRQVNAPLPTPPQEYTDPEVWLKDIRELRKQNKQEQADQEWRRFRAAFPAYEVAETDAAREAKK